ncbi:uracil-DNA glycosylase [Pusillimonas sp.]|uniref:uracil-DNA glycosylase n=1 Tax=Pusillimonas sp. TaxID=3040095 RepID=UPI0029ADD66F|nr:uracil-DNA glycosylase [Pusillimonas sp.]MDX3893549.1 uracil-DNA glycosylase [Pusillimonas sp.]
MSERLPDPPRLTDAQRLWLQEIGLDRPMLARLARGGAPAQGGPRAAATGGADVAGAAQGVRAAAAADSVALETGAADEMGAGTAVSDNRSRALAALAALKQGGGERGRAAPGPGVAKPARDVPPADTVAARMQTPPAPMPAPEAPATHSTLAVDAPTPDSPARSPDGARDESPEWEALEASIQACEACGLHAGRHSAVPGAGATQTVDWLVVGEAPGGRDDGLGRPFQGTAGDLLHIMLAAADIEPGKKVFYTNLVKCRPRSNRPPTPEEIAACLPHLHSQIALLRPRAILALGRLAAQALLGEATSFEQYRGRVHAFQSGGSDIPVVVTYHPASLLSRPRHKAASWRDLNLARSLI